MENFDSVTHFHLADLFSESYLCICQTLVWIGQVFPVASKSSKGARVVKTSDRNFTNMTNACDRNLYITTNMTIIMTMTIKDQVIEKPAVLQTLHKVINISIISNQLVQ